MTRLYGRSLRGTRVYDRAPFGHWNTTTMLSSVQLNGKTNCMIFDGSTDTEAFLVYLKNVLCPNLKKNDIVIMDNLAVHRVSKVSDIINSYGAKLKYLPPYSPDLNPIEKMWSKVKTYIRKHKPRKIDELEKIIKEALSLISKKDVKGWFEDAGVSLS